MATIPLQSKTRIVRITKGHEALIDEEDFESILTVHFRNDREWTGRVCDLSWQASVNKWGVYAYAAAGGRKTRVVMLMHRLITGAAGGAIVDHVNHNGLDNRRCNLRVCTMKENSANSRLQSNTTTGFKGVSTIGNRFRAQIGVSGEYIALGCFDTAELAAAAYDSAARQYFGEFALTNFMEQ